MPEFKPAYLIHGDDHGRIGERRAALRALAEREPARAASSARGRSARRPTSSPAALAAMTFAIGRRVPDRRRRRALEGRDLARHLLPALASIGPETTIAFFAREEGRHKVSAELAKAVEKAGGGVARRTQPQGQGAAALAAAARPAGSASPWIATPRRRSSPMSATASSACCASSRSSRSSSGRAPDRPTRRARRRTPAEHQVWGARRPARRGRRPRATTRAFLELAAQGESLARLVPLLARRSARCCASRCAWRPARRPRDQGLDQGQCVGRWTGASPKRAPTDAGAPAPGARGARHLELASHGASRAARSHRAHPGDRAIAA